MDQVKIGNLIKECRKDKNLTQSQLADKLYVSPKTISKWECGNGTPDVSLMKPLCDELDISLNELLTGERIPQEEYIAKAEENLLLMKKMAKKDDNLKLILQIIILAIGVVVMGVAIFISTFSSIEVIYARILGITGVIAFLATWIVTLLLEMDSGYYECSICHEKFVPKFHNFLLKPKFMEIMKLTCPKCHNKNYCKHIYYK